MNTSISTKFAALTMTLIANSVLMGSIAYLFNAHQFLSLAAVA